MPVSRVRRPGHRGQRRRETPAAPLASAARARGATEQSALPVTVTIDALDPGRPVAQRFLGLSFEVAVLRQLSQYTDRGDLVRLLRSLGPGMLRFGGITADENVAWTDAATPRPAWASSTIDAAQLRAIGGLARRSGWQVLLTVGLAHDEPTAAAREVAAAHRALGPYLAAVEIGNEPDAYGSHDFRELPWIAQGYEEEVSSYREAIAALTPGVPIAGPDVSGSGVFPEWGEEEALTQGPALLTGHHYPLGCTQTPAPSIEALLSAAVRGARRARWRRTCRCPALVRHPAADRRDQLRLLWGSGWDQRHVRLGAVGDRLHHAGDGGGHGRHQSRGQSRELHRICATVRARSGGARERQAARRAGLVRVAADEIARRRPSAAYDDRRRRLPRPRSSVILGARPLPDGGARRRRTAGTSPLALRLDVGAGMGVARILRLTAPSQSATGGVLLAGRPVAPDGSWRAPTRMQSVATRSGILALELVPDSAALVTVSPSRAGR